MEITQSIEKLNQILSPASQKAIEEYTKWFVWKGFMGTLVGVLIILTGCLLLSYLLKMARQSEYDKSNYRIGAAVALIACLVIGGLIVACFFPDLMAPKGYAIHQFIIDLRG